MLVVHVHVHVKEEFIEQFRAACIENAKNSVQEPGISRFDVLQNNEDPTRFALNEVYKTAEATIAHKGTDHYKKWRDVVEEMMAEPRYSVKYTNIYPTDDAW